MMQLDLNKIVLQFDNVVESGQFTRGLAAKIRHCLTQIALHVIFPDKAGASLVATRLAALPAPAGRGANVSRAAITRMV
ncbi:MAG: hypothetical protein ACOY7J_10145 [Pseudomonadota bacterium]